MAPSFKLAVENYPRFLVNSADTKRKLSAHCRPDADITLYRPPVRNVFDLRPDDRMRPIGKSEPLRLVAFGTVEPRKNFVAAARVLAALREQNFSDATLEIVGRRGWGDDWGILEQSPGVILHGYQSGERVREILQGADVFICTSHEEGLGLPLLEAQYAGLPIAAPNAAIFREVLGQSGILIDSNDPAAAASAITAALSEPAWRTSFAARGTENLARWNALASSDRGAVIDLIMALSQRRPRADSRKRSVAP
jgi:glycosyltransferase involved in cell wall biosynthesis